MTPNIALRSKARQQGAALIITLFFIVIITTLAVAYMTSSRMERSASNSHFERARAANIARSAVDQVIATLQRETSDPNRNWVSQPGMLTVASGSDPARKTALDTTVYLSSGAPSVDEPADPTFEPANLNVQTLQDQGQKSYLVMDPEVETTDDGSIIEEPIEMKLRWVYVRKDGQLELPNQDEPISPTNLPVERPTNLTDRNNPIVGRFAYWADDESSKLNANLAWTRDPNSLNKNLPGHQTMVDLRALPNFENTLSNGWTIGDAVHNSVTDETDPAKSNYQAISRFFNSPLDMRRMAQPTLISQLGLQSSDGDLLRIALERNKFNLTHYNHDPDTTYYGKSRMVLTTQLANAVMRDTNGNVIMVNGKPLHRPFLDIIKRTSDTDMRYVDPGYANPNVIDVDKLNTVIQDLIANYLQKNDWPMVNPAGGADKPSVQLKYYRNYPANVRNQRLAQIALNIIDYVRSAESKKTIVEPIRGRFLNNVFVPDFHPAHIGEIQGRDDTFKGIVRSPYITEMGFWMADKPEGAGKANAGRYRCIGFLEVYLPPDYGIDQIDLLETIDHPDEPAKNWRIWFSEFQRTREITNPDGTKKTVPFYYTFDEKPANVEAVVKGRVSFNIPAKNSPEGAAFVWEAVGPGRTKFSKMGPGEYRRIAFEAFKDVSIPDGGNPLNERPINKISLRTAITMTGKDPRRVDVTPLSNEGADSAKVWIIPNPPGVLPDAVDSWETVDPRVNGLAKDWQHTTVNTFGRQNNAWTSGIITGTYKGGGVGGNPINVLPEQDRDKNGKVSAASLRMPYPFGHKLNPTGRVRSPGELGLIHTGIEGSNAAQQPGIPWRTLHLQPSSQGTTVVPDWAFMDLFTVPTDVPEKAALLFSPHSSSTGGRVNMNAKPEPFEQIDRIHPLAAVLYGCRTNTLNDKRLTLPEAMQIADNIYKRIPAKKTTLPAGKQYPSNSPTQVYDSPGEVVEMLGVADGGEESEELVREIANLITARGNVFSIYTIGQALKQTPDGRLIVTAEQRQHALVERYLVDKNTPDPTDDEIGFRSVYFRNLTP